MKSLTVYFSIFALLFLNASSVYAETNITSSHSTDILYTDTKTNATFLVPTGWGVKPLNEPRESIDVKFVPDDPNEFMHIIMYGSYDVFGKELEEAGLTREDINNSIISKYILSVIFKVDPSDINIVGYGSYNYCKQEAIGEYESEGLTVNIQTTRMAAIENGYVFLFQFFGSTDGRSFEDFESMLSSATFP